jgi:hypothetical protein
VHGPLSFSRRPGAFCIRKWLGHGALNSPTDMTRCRLDLVEARMSHGHPTPAAGAGTENTRPVPPISPIRSMPNQLAAVM